MDWLKSVYGVLCLISMVTCETIDINVNIAAYIPHPFVGIALSSGVIKDKWRTMNFTSQKMKTLAKNLSPSYLRFGGTGCDYLIFNMTEDTTLQLRPSPDPLSYNENNYTMTPADWDTLNIFIEESGFGLIWDFNLFLRRNGQWDPTNAIELLKYTVEKGYKPVGYELGNEPDLFPLQFKRHIISAEQLVKDYQIFDSVLLNSGVSSYFVNGPETAGSYSGYFYNFLKDGGAKLVDIASFHHYYLWSNAANVNEFHDYKILDSLIYQIDKAVNACHTFAPSKQCWLGETSSTYGGGAGGVSDRYVAGFMWLDKLGLSASRGLHGVIRQTFYGGNYGLINKDLNPNPDYFLTVLFKRLVGTRVLNMQPSANTNFRLYAHCTNTNSSFGYKAGDVTVYVMNLGQDPITFNIAGVSQPTRHLYLLSPGDGGLTSPFVKLNGVKLELPNDTELPVFNPKVQQSGPIQLDGFNMGFIIIPNAQLPQCM